MKILAAARHPGPAESISPVVKLLIGRGHSVTLIGMRNDTPETRIHGGSATKFRQIGLKPIEMNELGDGQNVVSITDTYTDAIFERFKPDRVLVGCSVDAKGNTSPLRTHFCQERIAIALRRCNWSRLGRLGTPAKQA